MANAWITFLTKYYQDRKKKQPGYSYSDAMKDAKIEYNKTKGTASSPSKSHKKGKKMRGGSGYGGEASLAGAASIDESSKTLLGGEDMASTAQEAATPATQSGGKKSRRRKGTKGKKSKKSKKCKSKRKSRSSRK
jgi:hypothetical protein